VFASVQLGHRIRSGSWLAASMAEVRATPIEDLAQGLGLDFLVGSFAFGATLGIPIGLVAAWAVARARRSHDPERELPEPLRADLEERLDFAPGWYRGYGGWKVKLDPVYPLALRALEGRRNIADLGGGIGLLAVMLAARDREARVTIVEWDEKKAAVARTVARDLPLVEVVAADATTFDASGCDAVALIDVLHYLPIPDQRAWLERLVKALGTEATVVIRELDSSAEKGRLAEIVDRWMVRLGWNRGGGVHAWPIAEMRALLEGEGFRVEVAEAGRGIFSANAIVVARRP
jgi:SAM-dependent methyltransferase